MRNYKKYFYIIILINFFYTCAHIAEKSNVPVVSLLPMETDVPGWELIKRPVYLDKKKIKNNKLLKSKGVLEYASCQFRSFSNKKQVFKIEIIKTNKSINAYAFFSQKRANVGIEENKNNKLVITKSGVYALKGEFYFSIESNLEKNRSQDLMKFFETIDKKIIPIKKGIKFPVYLGLFVQKTDFENLIYYKNGHRDIPGSKDMFVVKKERSLFFLKKENDFDAMNLYNAMIKSRNNKFIVSKSSDIELIYNEKNNKFIFISSYKNYIFGILNAESIIEGKKVIKETHDNLKNNLKNLKKGL